MTLHHKSNPLVVVVEAVGGHCVHFELRVVVLDILELTSIHSDAINRHYHPL